jgi:hypothetical protein
MRRTWALLLVALVACGDGTTGTTTSGSGGSGGATSSSGVGGRDGGGGSAGEEPAMPSCAPEAVDAISDGEWICSVCVCAGQVCSYRPFMGGEPTMGACGEDLKCSAECPSELTPP